MKSVMLVLMSQKEMLVESKSFYKIVLCTFEFIFHCFCHVPRCLWEPSAGRPEQCARCDRWLAARWGCHWRLAGPPWAAWSGASLLWSPLWMRKRLCSSSGPGVVVDEGLMLLHLTVLVVFVGVDCVTLSQPENIVHFSLCILDG